MSVWTINGVDMEALGFTLARVENWSAGVRHTYESATAPLYFGRVQSADATLAPRAVQLSVNIPGDTIAARRANLDTLLAICGQSIIALTFGDATGRALYAKLVGEGATGESAYTLDWTAGMVATLEFACDDPAHRDTTDTVLSLSTTPVAVPMGNLPHGGVVRINGAQSGPTDIIVRNAGASTVATLRLSGAVGSGAHVLVDLEWMTITESTGASGLGRWPTLDEDANRGDWFVFDPAWATYTGTPAYPTIALSAGTGSLTYRRRWRS